MMKKSFGRVVLVLASVGLVPLTAFADEIVHFANGAEMTVRSHNVEPDKSMVKLDLGGNSFISFPMSMVDKIVNAGHDVFVNPNFHPSNQAIASGAVRTVDTTVRGGPDPVNFARQPDGKGHAGSMLGEAADVLPSGSMGSGMVDQTMANSRRKFNPALQGPPGGPPQVIMPPSMATPTRGPVQLAMIGAAAQPPPPAPVPAPTPENPPAEAPAPEDPPENP